MRRRQADKELCSVEGQCNQGLANTNKLTMSKKFAVRKQVAGSIGLASEESPDSWVACTMNGCLEMGNVYACDATSSSQCSVSKRTPEIHNYTYKFLPRKNTNTSPFILHLRVKYFLCVFNVLTFQASYSFVNSCLCWHESGD